MNPMVFKAAKVIAALTSLHVGLVAVGYDFCKPFHRYKFYWDVLAGIAGAIVLVSFFMY